MRINRDIGTTALQDQIYEIDIVDEDEDEKVGVLSSISPRGLLIKGLKPIEAYQFLSLRLQLPKKIFGKQNISLVGICAWYHLWDKKQQCNNLDDKSSCPKATPDQLSIEEIFATKDVTTSEEYRHVPTGTLAISAQRLGKVFESAATWHEFIKERVGEDPENDCIRPN